MEFKFNNIEEVLDFATTIRRAASYEQGQLNPKGIDPAELSRSIARIAIDGNRSKIQAIKLYRAVTGLGLRESKEAIERNYPFGLDDPRH
jgi:ribosomal protein L7/L12